VSGGATTSEPGLDLAALRGFRGPSARAGAKAIADITARIESHLAGHDGYLAFSGGKDSLVILDRARRVAPEVPVVFFDSGLDYPETYDYLTELAQAWRGKNNGAQQIQEVEGGLDRPLSNQPEISESHSPLD